jgi:hypothetical protein
MTFPFLVASMIRRDQVRREESLKDCRKHNTIEGVADGWATDPVRWRRSTGT